MQRVVTLYLDMPDDIKAVEFMDAMQSLQFTLALVGIHARVGAVVESPSTTRRAPKVNCNVPEGKPS